MPAPSQTADAARRARLTAIGLMCAAVICFALLDTNAKWLGQHGMSPLLVSFARYGVSVVLVSFLINPWSHPGVLRTRRPWLQFFRSLMLLGSTVLNFFALRHLQLAETISIMFAGPFLVALASGPLLGEWPGPRRLAAIGVGFLGVLVVTRPGIGGMHPAALPFVWTTPQAPLLWASLFATGFFGALGHWMLILAHRLAPATVLAPFIYSQLVWMVLMGWLVFGQWPDRWTFIGGGIVIASGLYLLYRERVRHVPEEASSVRLD